jgi:hypothetical protein
LFAADPSSSQKAHARNPDLRDEAQRGVPRARRPGTVPGMRGSPRRKRALCKRTQAGLVRRSNAFVEEIEDG